MTAVIPTDVQPLVDAELHTLYQRCHAAGVSREQVDAVLAVRFGPAGPAPLVIPERALVEQAWEYCRQGRVREAEDLARRWLLVAHRVREGDVALVTGWSRPREILIDKVQFVWGKQSALEEGWLRLDGPTVFIGGMGVRHNVTNLGARVTRQAYPSARMHERYPERFAGQLARRA